LAARLTLPLPVVLAIQVVQMGVLLLALGWLGLRLGQSLGLDSPFARALVYGHKPPAVSSRAVLAASITGIGGGLAIIALSLAFDPFMPATKEPLAGGIAMWKRLLVPF